MVGRHFLARALLVLASLWLLGYVGAQPSAAPTLKVGVIVSKSGSDARVGQAQELAVEAFLAQLRAQRPSGAIGLEFATADDGSLPNRAAREARRLIADEEVHALICCTATAATRLVSEVAEQQGVPLLALSNADEVGRDNPYWVFSIPPDSRKAIQAMVLHIAWQGGQSVALMALDNDYGEVAAQALDMLLEPGGLRLVAEERYPPNVEVLTPEALWVATRQPAGVIVWGLARDTVVAVDALRRRGFDGDVYINPAVATALNPLERMALEDVQVTTAPAQFADRLPASAPTYSETRRFATQLRRAGNLSPPYQAAYAWDAALLLTASLEQALILGLDLSESRVFRQVVRDSIISLGSTTGAAASYNYREGDHVGVEARSLVVARLTRTGLSPEFGVGP